MSRRSPAMKRIMTEAKELMEPTDQYHAAPLEVNQACRFCLVRFHYASVVLFVRLVVFVGEGGYSQLRPCVTTSCDVDFL